MQPPSQVLPSMPVLPPALPPAATPSLAPTLPPVPAAGPVQPQVMDGSKLTMFEPAGTGGGGTPWVVVLAIALVAEVALLWVASCLGLWRRRLAARAGRS
jgi:hypothetical protein